MAFSILEYLPSFQRYSCKKIDDVTNIANNFNESQKLRISPKILDGCCSNLAAVIHQVKHKMISSTLLSWQPLLLQGLFNAGLILLFTVVIRHVHSQLLSVPYKETLSIRGSTYVSKMTKG